MLRYVSFPTQTLFKCFKMVPVMLMGKVIGNKAYPSYDYAVAIMIGWAWLNAWLEFWGYCSWGMWASSPVSCSEMLCGSVGV